MSDRDRLFGGRRTAVARDHEQSSAMFEESNNREIDQLGDRVVEMKSLVGDIEAAIADDANELDKLDTAFDSVGLAMRNTLTSLNKMIATGGSKHMCYLMTFVVVVFFVLYKFMMRKV